MINDFAKRLRALREAEGISQAEFGRQIGLSRACVNNWENGHTYPNLETFVQLANFFGVSTDYFLGREQFSSMNVTGLSHADVAILENIAQRLRFYNHCSKEEV